jgi:hypothetical protein
VFSCWREIFSLLRLICFWTNILAPGCGFWSSTKKQWFWSWKLPHNSQRLMALSRTTQSSTYSVHTMSKLGGETPSQTREWGYIIKKNVQNKKTAVRLWSQWPLPHAKRCMSSRLTKSIWEKGCGGGEALCTMSRQFHVVSRSWRHFLYICLVSSCLV